jgi:hypothetical protein
MARDDEGVFCVKIDYRPGTPDPSRVFRAMSDMVTSLGEFDEALAESIGADIRTTVLLEDIDTGSLRVWLRNVVESVDDDALKELDWKKGVGAYLVKGKRVILRVLDGKKTISNRDEVREVQAELGQLALTTQITALPTYSPVPSEKILRAAQDVAAAASHLAPEDRVVYVSDQGEVPINRDFTISSEAVENLLTREVLTSEIVMILKVKKPDYLGSSMWEFRFEDRGLTAKIAHVEWLASFQARHVDVRPGDSIRARVVVEVKYGFDSEVVATHHTITKVIEVIPGHPPPQISLLPSST